jgi:serine/threonine-protein kinase
MSSEVLNDRYRLVAQQGSGGMAVIYKAQDMALGRTVAIKILRPTLTDDPSFLARFRNEARAVANLAHPNIVTVHDVGSDGRTHYIVMEFVKGEDLKKVVRAEGALSIDRALNLSIQICAGIGFAHRAGLVHADVKPQNVLVADENVVKVTDFGIAQALSETQPGERQSVVWGSPHYFAPEQARGERPSPASDVYSIGIVMFELLTGRLPYTGANQQELALAHIRDRVPMVTEFNPTIPETLSNIVYKVMSKEPANRYRMADQLGNILASYRERYKPAPPAAQSSGFQPVSQPSQPAQPSQPPPPRPTTPPPPSPGQPPPPWQTQSPAQPQPAPPRSGEALPTQRYGLAPQIPQTPGGYGQQPQQPQPGQPSAASPFMAGAAPSEPLSGTGRFYESRPYEPEEDGGIDFVTIALAFLAFVAVACLIPLYILVFQARFGG